MSRLGLRSRMATSYVLVSAAAVLLVEAVLLAVMVPRIRAATAAADAAQRRAEAADIDAARAQKRATVAEQGLDALKNEALARDLANALADQVEGTGGAGDDRALLSGAAGGAFAGVAGLASRGPAIVLVLAGVDGRVVAASPAATYPAGTALTRAVRADEPGQGDTLPGGDPGSWASAPIKVGGANPRVAGIAYAEVRPGADGEKSLTAIDRDPATGKPAKTVPATSVASLIGPGVVALVLLLPVGALFGLLSTGRLIRRIRRLSDGTAAMAGGDLGVRIPVSGGDEVGRLEQAFNAMAERLAAAVDEQRAAAGAEARWAERGRIARELHDSISQDLFSVSLVAGGLRKALDPGTTLQEQAASMERSLGRTMREMRALLLELRPIALEDAGLAAALHELCRAYEARLGIPIAAHLDEVHLDAAAEHAVLRVVQECVGNAVRHGDPGAIELRLTAHEDGVHLTVRDDGRGFDPQEASARHGMGLTLMRERVRELGGTVELDSAPERGTTVTVVLPAVQ